jgi:hypothetical protein
MLYCLWTAHFWGRRSDILIGGLVLTSTLMYQTQSMVRFQLTVLFSGDGDFHLFFSHFVIFVESVC